MFCIRCFSGINLSKLSTSRSISILKFHSGRHVRAKAKKASKEPNGALESPLKAELREAYFLRKSRKRNKSKIAPADRTRLQIVSESLCDDVLRRLGPSLERHTNCDIIDVNPGVGVWSSKLHDAINPRSHIFMEPDPDLYLPYLAPLIEKKGSKYKFVPKSGLIWENLKALMNGDLLKDQERFHPEDPHLGQPNDTLLFVANLGHFPKKSFQGFTSISLLTIHQLLTAIRTHALFQRYGQIRMLIWMHDKEKSAVLPRMIAGRRKFAVDAELVCKTIAEIAGSDDPSTYYRRETALDLESALAVKQRMIDDNIQTPPSRVGTLQAKAEGHIPTSNLGKELVTTKNWMAELEDLRGRYERKDFPACYDKNGKPVYLAMEDGVIKQNTSKHLVRTPEFNRMRRLRWNMEQLNRKADQFQVHIDEYEQLVAELASLQGDQSPEALKKRIDTTEKLKSWRHTVENALPDKNGARILQFMEDRRSLRQEPALLLWDRRKAEPLKTMPTEFYPEHEMCLLDFQPKLIWPVLRGQNSTNYDYFDFLMTSLYAIPTQPLVQGLKAIAPGAAEWILPKCPSLTDTANGGVASVEELPVRGLTANMMREIIENFMEWPFRPTKGEMMTRLSGANVDDILLMAKEV